MRKITFGLINRETQEPMKGHLDPDTGYMEMHEHGNVRYEVEDLSQIVSFFYAKGERGRFRAWETEGIDPDEYAALAFTYEEDRFSKSEKAEILELPIIKVCDRITTRSLSLTPRNVLKSYFPNDVIEAIGPHSETFLIKTKTGQPIETNDAVFFDHWATNIGIVDFVSSIPEKWPLEDPLKDEQNWSLVISNGDQEAFLKKCRVYDISSYLETHIKPGL